MYNLEIARSFSYQKIDDETMKLCSDVGIKQIEFGVCGISVDFDDAEIAELIDRCVEIIHRHNIKILSVHLPFGPTWELCTCDDAIREHAMNSYIRLIKICSRIKPERFVLHPGYPRVPVEERERRIENFRKNVAILSAEAMPAKIAVENMPQDCLGNTADELIRLVDGIDNVCVCCDMNHWFHEKTYDAVRKLGKRIETIHVSDYDEEVEKHWLPGQGTNDWNKILGELDKIGYRGPFMYECSQVNPSDVVAANKRELFENYNNSAE